MLWFGFYFLKTGSHQICLESMILLPQPLSAGIRAVYHHTWPLIFSLHLPIHPSFLLSKYLVIVTLLCICEFIFLSFHIGIRIQGRDFLYHRYFIRHHYSLGSSMLTRMTGFHSFCGWVIFHCVDRPHVPYPFKHRWTLGLILYLSKCVECCHNSSKEHLLWVNHYPGPLS